MLRTPRYGIEGQQAPEWGVAQWFNLPQDKPSLTLRDVANEIVYLYCFQSWCPGCLKHGFPTLMSVFRLAVSTDERGA